MSIVKIVDCAVWLLFNKQLTDNVQSHLLCRGFQRSQGRCQDVVSTSACSIPGITLDGRPNSANTLKTKEWHQIATLLGAHGYPVMLELLLDHGLFMPICNGSKTVTQVSGAR